MTYSQALEKIHSLLTFGSRPGLDRMRKLLELMGNPQDKLRYIHVAGTNGKGSVCALLSSALVAAGYKTGLFISPYITDFRERIQINNKMISEEELASAVEATFPLVEGLRAEGTIITEFEYVNALEFYIHASEKCDVVVLETGMGGLLDCTNVINPPLCSVITVIGLDHTAILGDTVEEIARQKCGIIKRGSAVVSSAQCDDAQRVIAQTAASLSVPLYQSGDIEINVKKSDIFGSVFEYEGEELTLPLAGIHQLENVKTALAALKALNENGSLKIFIEDIKAGFASAKNPARLQLLSDSPVTLLDGAHNPNGIHALRESLKAFLPGKKLFCVMGMLADKDVDSAAALFDGMFECIVTVPVNNPRAMSPAALAQKLDPYCGDVVACDSLQRALERSRERALAENGAVIVCGSLYLASEVLGLTKY